MIQIQNLYKEYNKREILRNISLTVENGCIQALLGANGAGKSTLIYSVGNIIEYKAQKIEYDFDNTGFVFDKPTYIEKFSANEYLEFVALMRKLPKEACKVQIRELLTLFELPMDNEKYIESYSKGMKAKVSLAAAILNNPCNLILDEPFDGVDFLSIQKIIKLLKDMSQKGCAILITSHQYDIIADVCTKFALLADGGIVFNKTMNELEEQAINQFGRDKQSVKLYLENEMCKFHS